MEEFINAKLIISILFAFSFGIVCNCELLSSLFIAAFLFPSAFALFPMLLTAVNMQ